MISVGPVVNKQQQKFKSPTVTKNSLLWSQSQEIYGWLFSEPQNLRPGCVDLQIFVFDGMAESRTYLYFLFIMKIFNHKSRREYYNEPPDPITLDLIVNILQKLLHFFLC